MEATSNIPNLLEFLEDDSKYTHFLSDSSNWRFIPLLNHTPLHELRDFSLVRFRGMIQDMNDPEIYLEQYQVISTTDKARVRVQNGKYRDCLVLQLNEMVDFESEENIQAQRRTMFVVSLPAINSWASEIEEVNCRNESRSSFCSELEYKKIEKRPIIDEDDSEMVDLDLKSNIKNQPKRKCTEVTKTASIPTAGISLSMEYLLNSPIPNRPSKVCMIKLYNHFESHTLNSMVDVIGFLSIDPALDASTIDLSDNDFENSSEIQAQNPPPSLIPRLHVITIKKLPHCNPLLDNSICKMTAPSINFESVNKDLKILLTQCLMGDALTAEYLLAHLISTVYIRSDLHSIGKFALNICNLPQGIVSNYTKKLYDILELFLPASHYLPMTLEVMNTTQFFPKKDYQTNKLTSGILQLAPHTHLVLDETRLQPGKLETNGVQAVQQLAHFIKTQDIKCNFQYYDIDFNMDIPVLVLSEGKSMLPNDFLVPLNPDSDCIGLIDETLKAVKHYAQPKLDAIRRYLTSAKVCNFDMNPAESEMIQTDFVEMRKIDPKVGTDELHSLLVLSRLLAIGGGKTTLDRECWDQAKNLEALRKSRVESMPKSSRIH